MRRVLVTGAAGYLGSRLVQSLAEGLDRSDSGCVVAADIRELDDAARLPGVDYLRWDVREPGLDSALRRFAVDTVVHLAAIVTPGPKSNRELEYAVDVEGTRNVLEACCAAGVRRVVVTSSGAAYGYHPDNPEWLSEDDPIRGNEEFAYSFHKRLVEDMLLEYRRKLARGIVRTRQAP
jgi:UDP-glucose 4-epimerase